MKTAALITGIICIICVCASFWLYNETHNEIFSNIFVFLLFLLMFPVLVFSAHIEEIKREEFINNPTTIHTTGINPIVMMLTRLANNSPTRLRCVSAHTCRLLLLALSVKGAVSPVIALIVNWCPQIITSEWICGLVGLL